MLEECCVFLYDVVLQDDLVDTWQWYSEPAKGYNVCCVYHLLTTADQSIHFVIWDLIWHNQDPLKVLGFAWRLLRNRISTKDNLFDETFFIRILNYVWLVAICLNQQLNLVFECLDDLERKKLQVVKRYNNYLIELSSSLSRGWRITMSLLLLITTAKSFSLGM